MSRTLLVVVSDLHINSTSGLSQPHFRLDNGTSYDTGKNQLWLWREWNKFWMMIENLRHQEDDTYPVVTVINGDLVDLNRHNQNELISLNRADIVRNAIGTLEPLIHGSDRIAVIRGTEAHVGNQGELEELVARGLPKEKVIKDDNTGLWSFWRLQLEVQECLFDFAHVGAIGTKTWTRNNPLNTLASEVALSCLKDNLPLPKYVVRSHFHQYAESSIDFPVRVIQTPCWQLNNSYVYKIGIPTPPSVGALVFLCENGDAELTTYFSTPESVQPIKL